MTRQFFHVSADKDREIVIVLDRESAAACLTHLRDAADACRAVGASWRADLIGRVISELEDNLRD